MILRELFAVKQKQPLLESIAHPEDLIISQGSAGAKRVMAELAGLSKNSNTISDKWDGFPAVVFGRDEQGTLVFMDKHMYDKVANGKLQFMSIREYDDSRGVNRGDLWEKESILVPALEKIIPNIKNKFYMGDLMWTGTPSTSDNFFVFKPNTVEYRVKITA